MECPISREEFVSELSRITRIDERITRKFSPELGESCYKNGRYPYIRFPYPREIYDMFKLLYEKTQGGCRNFLDVGCGTGRMLKLAELWGFNSFGVEIEEKFVEPGLKAYKIPKNRITIKDANLLDYEFLKEFNIIYTYMPIRDMEKMSLLHLNLWNNAEKYTIFVETLPRYYPLNIINHSEGRNLAYLLNESICMLKKY